MVYPCIDDRSISRSLSQWKNARFLTPFVRAFQLRGDPPSGDAAVVGPVRRSRAVLALGS
jgi:hypothetical protein